MSALAGHWGYVAAAYALTAVVMVGATLAIVLDGRRLRKRIAALEARGVRRRSAGSGGA